jgi:hypothetical protein
MTVLQPLGDRHSHLGRPKSLSTTPTGRISRRRTGITGPPALTMALWRLLPASPAGDNVRTFSVDGRQRMAPNWNCRASDPTRHSTGPGTANSPLATGDFWQEGTGTVSGGSSTFLNLPQMATREERIRERLFPGTSTYDRDQGGFTALPIILRRVQWLFEARGWQTYTYIAMRAGPAGIAWFTLSEMAWDLGYKSVSKLRPYVDALVEMGWVERESSQGRDYYICRDPVEVLQELHKKKPFAPERLESIEELLESLKLPSIVPPSEPRKRKSETRLVRAIEAISAGREEERVARAEPVQGLKFRDIWGEAEEEPDKDPE